MVDCGCSACEVINADDRATHPAATRTPPLFGPSMVPAIRSRAIVRLSNLAAFSRSSHRRRGADRARHHHSFWHFRRGRPTPVRSGFHMVGTSQVRSRNGSSQGRDGNDRVTDVGRMRAVQFPTAHLGLNRAGDARRGWFADGQVTNDRAWKADVPTKISKNVGSETACDKAISLHPLTGCTRHHGSGLRAQ